MCMSYEVEFSLVREESFRNIWRDKSAVNQNRLMESFCGCKCNNRSYEATSIPGRFHRATIQNSSRHA